MDNQNYPQQNGNQPQYGYPQAGYPQGAYPMQPQVPKGASVAALVCGLLGIIGSFIPIVCYFTLVLAILGIVFGVVGQKKATAYGVKSGLAIAGLVLGIIGTAFSLAGVICALACASSVASLF